MTSEFKPESLLQHPLAPEEMVDTPDKFVETYFSHFRKNYRNKMINYLSRDIYTSGEEWGRPLEIDILRVYNSLNDTKEIVGHTKRDISARNLSVGGGVIRYVNRIVNGDMGNLAHSFDRETFTTVFMEAYKHLSFKQAGILMEIFGKEDHIGASVDSNFWKLVDNIGLECDAETTGLFSRQLMKLNILTDAIKRWHDKNIPNVSENFQKNFLKMVKSYGYKYARVFSQGVRTLVLDGVYQFDGYKDSSDYAMENLDPDLAYWAIHNSASFEKENFDYGPHQLINDTKMVDEKYGKKSALGYLYGISGVIKAISEINGGLLSTQYNLSEFDSRDPDFENQRKNYREEKYYSWRKEGIPEAHISFDKDFRREYDQKKKEILDRQRKILPVKEAERYLIDPNAFKANYLLLLQTLGTKAGYLYSRAFYSSSVGSGYSSPEEESDVHFLARLPDVLIDLNKSVSKKVFDKMLFFAGKMTVNAVVLKNIFDGVEKCFKTHGENETINRLKYTYTVDKYRTNIVFGLERPGGMRTKDTPGRRELNKKLRELEEKAKYDELT